MIQRRLFWTLCFVFVSTVANAGIVFDWSPDATGATASDVTNYTNQDDEQYLADMFTLSAATDLTGVDIYSDENVGAVGQPVIIRFWSNDAGVPGTLLQTFNETISIVDTEGVSNLSGITRKHADLSSVFTVAAGTTYWVSMTGGYDSVGSPASSIGQMTLSSNPPGNGTAYFFTFLGDGTQELGNVSFRLEGTLTPVTAVPEPATMLSALFAGVLTLTAARRRLV